MHARLATVLVIVAVLGHAAWCAVTNAQMRAKASAIHVGHEELLAELANMRAEGQRLQTALEGVTRLTEQLFVRVRTHEELCAADDASPR